MAKSQPNSATMLLIIAFLLLASSSSFSVVAARLLILPGILPAVEASPDGGRYLECDSGVVYGNRKVGTVGFDALRLCGKRSQLVLSMLPKGGVPPSGPSHRSNYVNN